MEREKTVWSQKHTTLSKEQELLVQTNKQLYAEIERLREEVEANKDYIEELKDRVANYKLNSNLKEVHMIIISLELFHDWMIMCVPVCSRLQESLHTY